MAEGEIVSWVCRSSDAIEEGAPLLELQNDKLVQEIPSPVTGVKNILVEPEPVLKCSDPLIEIEVEGAVSVDKHQQASEETPVTAATPNGVIKCWRPCFSNAISA